MKVSSISSRGMVAILAVALLVSTALVQARSTSPEGFSGQVVAVLDGDTLEVIQRDPAGSRQVMRHRIRLAEIDAPEKGQPYGRRAKQALAVLVSGSPVRVVPVDTDRYGRMVAHIYAGEAVEVWVNVEMVRQGAAWVYPDYAKTLAIRLAEIAARKEGAGLWALPEAERIPPWEWRKARSQAAR